MLFAQLRQRDNSILAGTGMEVSILQRVAAITVGAPEICLLKCVSFCVYQTGDAVVSVNGKVFRSLEKFVALLYESRKVGTRPTWSRVLWTLVGDACQKLRRDDLL